MQISLQKTELRRTLRQRRATLTLPQQHAADAALGSHACQVPEWEETSRIAVYLPINGEIGTAALIGAARRAGKSLHLPVVAPQGALLFARWDPADSLTPNRFGIPEPSVESADCTAQALDIVFMPLVGWDAYGGRLGMGGGYYDRAFNTATTTVKVGLAHECQRVEEVPREPWDITMDYVITPAGVHHCGQTPQ